MCVWSSHIPYLQLKLLIYIYVVFESRHIKQSHIQLQPKTHCPYLLSLCYETVHYCMQQNYYLFLNDRFFIDATLLTENVEMLIGTKLKRSVAKRG